ncbi:MAG: hypothetical protein IKS42_10065 [Oscillospiraceae bacterium]|nr:hypothetical protein [Oscillospiraceae bacterium]
MGTGAAIFLIIVFVLCVLLLLPVRIKGSFGDGKWAVTVYYAFIRVFRKSSEPEKPPDAQPDKPPADTSEAAQEEKPETAPEVKPEPDAVQTESPAAPEAPAETVPQAAEPAAEVSAPAEPQEPEPKPQVQTEEFPAQEPEAPHAVTAAEETAPEPAASAEEPEADETAPETGETAEQAEEKPKKRGFFKRIKPQSVPEAIGLAKDALASLSPALKFLTRHFHFRHVKLYLAVATDDPAKTGTLYGRICAAAYNLLAALQCWVDIEADEFRILADFYNDSITFRASLELRVSPAALILTVLILGIRFLWRTWCRFRREDKEAKRMEEETRPLPDSAAA